MSGASGAARAGAAGGAGPTTGDRFLETYVGLMDVRLGQLAQAIRSGEVIEAQLIAMTLHSTSVLAGATRLAGVAAQIEQYLAHGWLDRATEQLPELLAAGSEAVSSALGRSDEPAHRPMAAVRRRAPRPDRFRTRAPLALVVTDPSPMPTARGRGSSSEAATGSRL